MLSFSVRTYEDMTGQTLAGWSEKRPPASKEVSSIAQTPSAGEACRSRANSTGEVATSNGGKELMRFQILFHALADTGRSKIKSRISPRRYFDSPLAARCLAIFSRLACKPRPEGHESLTANALQLY